MVKLIAFYERDTSGNINDSPKKHMLLKCIITLDGTSSSNEYNILTYWHDIIYQSSIHRNGLQK